MANSQVPSPIAPIELQHGRLVFGERTLVMGIVNVTDDSFSGDGLRGCAHAAGERAARFADEGADILDVGAESTRPGAEAVPEQEELDRVVSAVERIRQRTKLPISVDTTKPGVARRAVEAGADMVNDILGLQAPAMMETVAKLRVPAIVMHMQGTPRTMQVRPQYDDVVGDISAFLAARIAAAAAAGIPRESIIIDPGFGFGKTEDHNLELLRRLEEFRALGRPILIGTSRKSTIGSVLDLPVEERLLGTAATCAVAIRNGADIIRVHDVTEMVQVARMTDAIVR